LFFSFYPRGMTCSCCSSSWGLRRCCVLLHATRLYYPHSRLSCSYFVQRYQFRVNRTARGESAIAEERRDVADTCRCPPSCRQVAYDATLSSSLLSDMFINSLLARRFWPRIRGRYGTAVDVQSRVDTASMGDVLRQLANVERISRALGRTVDDDLLNADTSTLAFVRNAVDSVVERTRDCVDRFGAHLLRRYADVYRSNVDFFVHRIVASANAFLAIYASSSGAPESRDPDVFRGADEFCRHYTKFWSWFDADFRDPFRAKTYSSRKTCDDQLKRRCDEYLRTGRELADVHNQTGGWLACMTEFREFLDDASSWLKTKDALRSDLLLQTAGDDVVRVRDRLRNNTDRFASITERFRLHLITKVRRPTLYSSNSTESVFLVAPS